MSINRVVISGNLTREPDLRVTAGGTSILNLGVAVNDRRRNAQTGEWEDVANFVDCVMFGKRAESVSRFLTKGSKVAIEGSLRYSTWKDKKTGDTRSRLEVIVNEIEFLSRNNNQNASNGYQNAPQPQPNQNVGAIDEMYDKDIPF